MQERRNRKRRELVYYLNAFDRSNEQLLGYVANISTGGVMLIGEKPIEPNTICRFKMHFPVDVRGKRHVDLEATSRWSRMEGNTAFFSTGFQLGEIGPDDADIIQRILSTPTFGGTRELTSKRLFDVLLSFLGLVLLSPIFLLIGLILKLESSDPPFYKANRVGRFGRPFLMYKFRTMIESPESNGPRITAHDDPRITHIGRFLRQTKLNELPQLFNVLKGEMSLVGPRPEDEVFVAHYTPQQREVLSVKPGITSLATILYASEEKMLSFSKVTDAYLRSILPDKLRFDLLYVRNRSLLLDMDILIQTMRVLIPRFRKATPQIEDILLGPMRKIRRYLSWFATDAIIAFLAVATAGLIWRITGPLDIGLGRSLIGALAMTTLFSATNWITGVQRVHWRYATAIEAFYVMLSVSFSTAILLLINAFVMEPRFPPEMLLIASCSALAGFLVARYHRRLLTGLRHRVSRFRGASVSWREKVLVVGAGESGQITTWLLRAGGLARAFQVVGVVDDDIDKLGTLMGRVPVLGRCDRIPEIVRQHDISSIVFSIDNIGERQRSSILSLCRQTGARTVVVPNIVNLLREGIRSGMDAQKGAEISVDGLKTTERVRWSSSDLRHRIYALAELARTGDLAGVTNGLTQLQEALHVVDQHGDASASPWWNLESGEKDSVFAMDATRQQPGDFSEPPAGGGSFV